MEDQENNPKKIPIILMVITAIQVLFIILLVVSISGINQNDRIINPDDGLEITIKDFSSKIPDFSDEYINDIQHNLTDALRLNVLNLNIPNSEAIIRDGSITTRKFDKHGFIALSFIVDIPSLQQSYQIYYKYPSNLDAPAARNSGAVLCIEEESQIIYPGFKCNTNYPSDVRYRIFADYFKYLEFTNFSFTINKQDLSQITIAVGDEIDPALYESYIDQVKSIITSLGISSNLFTYRVITPSDFTYDFSEFDLR